jgi:hypothetical protein
MEFHNLDARISQIVMTCMTICYSSMRYFGYLASLVSNGCTTTDKSEHISGLQTLGSVRGV